MPTFNPKKSSNICPKIDMSKIKIPIGSKIIHRQTGEEFITGTGDMPLAVINKEDIGIISIKLMTRRLAGLSRYYPMEEDWLFDQWLYNGKTFFEMKKERMS